MLTASSPCSHVKSIVTNGRWQFANFLRAEVDLLSRVGLLYFSSFGFSPLHDWLSNCRPYLVLISAGKFQLLPKSAFIIQEE